MDAHRRNRRGRQRSRRVLAASDPPPADQAATPDQVSTSLELQVGAGRRRDTGTARLLMRAIREEWPIPTAQRSAAMEFLARVVAQGEARSGLAAVQAMIAADNVNAKRESTDTRADLAEVSAARDALRQLLADPVRAAALLGGEPPQLPGRGDPPQLTHLPGESDACPDPETDATSPNIKQT